MSLPVLGCILPTLPGRGWVSFASVAATECLLSPDFGDDVDVSHHGDHRLLIAGLGDFGDDVDVSYRGDHRLLIAGLGDFGDDVDVSYRGDHRLLIAGLGDFGDDVDVSDHWGSG